MYKEEITYVGQCEDPGYGYNILGVFSDETKAQEALKKAYKNYQDIYSSGNYVFDDITDTSFSVYIEPRHYINIEEWESKDFYFTVKEFVVDEIYMDEATE